MSDWIKKLDGIDNESRSSSTWRSRDNSRKSSRSLYSSTTNSTATGSSAGSYSRRSKHKHKHHAADATTSSPASSSSSSSSSIATNSNTDGNYQRRRHDRTQITRPSSVASSSFGAPFAPFVDASRPLSSQASSNKLPLSRLSIAARRRQELFASMTNDESQASSHSSSSITDNDTSTISSASGSQMSSNNSNDDHHDIMPAARDDSAMDRTIADGMIHAAKCLAPLSSRSASFARSSQPSLSQTSSRRRDGHVIHLATTPNNDTSLSQSTSSASSLSSLSAAEFTNVLINTTRSPAKLKLNLVEVETAMSCSKMSGSLAPSLSSTSDPGHTIDNINDEHNESVASLPSMLSTFLSSVPFDAPSSSSSSSSSVASVGMPLQSSSSLMFSTCESLSSTNTSSYAPFYRASHDIPITSLAAAIVDDIDNDTTSAIVSVTSLASIVDDFCSSALIARVASPLPMKPASAIDGELEALHMTQAAVIPLSFDDVHHHHHQPMRNDSGHTNTSMNDDGDGIDHVPASPGAITVVLTNDALLSSQCTGAHSNAITQQDDDINDDYVPQSQAAFPGSFQGSADETAVLAPSSVTHDKGDEHTTRDNDNDDEAAVSAAIEVEAMQVASLTHASPPAVVMLVPAIPSPSVAPVAVVPSVMIKPRKKGRPAWLMDDDDDIDSGHVDVLMNDIETDAMISAAMMITNDDNDLDMPHTSKSVTLAATPKQTSIASYLPSVTAFAPSSPPPLVHVRSSDAGAYLRRLTPPPSLGLSKPAGSNDHSIDDDNEFTLQSASIRSAYGAPVDARATDNAMRGNRGGAARGGGRSRGRARGRARGRGGARGRGRGGGRGGGGPSSTNDEPISATVVATTTPSVATIGVPPRASRAQPRQIKRKLDQLRDGNKNDPLRLFKFRRREGKWIKKRGGGARCYIAYDGTRHYGDAAEHRATLDRNAIGNIRMTEQQVRHAIIHDDDDTVASLPSPGASWLDGVAIPGKTNRYWPGAQFHHWHIPSLVIDQYMSTGVTSMYDWQVASLMQPEVATRGRNLVYAAPTSGGKTLVAEILMIRRLCTYGKKKALFIVPFVSMVVEKTKDLTRKLLPIGKLVRGYHGGADQSGGTLPPTVDIAVCTIEKANAIVNQLLEQKRLDELCVVVVDELHMIGDPDRGPTLELMLTKLHTPDVHIQIVGMSATLPNLDMVAGWLDAEVYSAGTFRPVPLVHMTCMMDQLHDDHGRLVRTLSCHTEDGREGILLSLCHEVTINGHGVLVFVSSKKGCRDYAESLTLSMARSLKRTYDAELEAKRETRRAMAKAKGQEFKAKQKEVATRELEETMLSLALPSSSSSSSATSATSSTTPSSIDIIESPPVIPARSVGKTPVVSSSSSAASSSAFRSASAQLAVDSANEEASRFAAAISDTGTTVIGAVKHKDATTTSTATPATGKGGRERKGAKPSLVPLDAATLLMLASQLPQYHQREAICDQLRALPEGIDDTLAVTIPFGVAYHHAGLTTDERSIIEEGFRSGSINVLMATSTLGAGVNLPARRVIFRQPKIGIDRLDVSRYRQMAGRAGRAGKDTFGESIVICSNAAEEEWVQRLMNDNIAPLESSLHRALERGILEVIAADTHATISKAHTFVSRSLFGTLCRHHDAELRWKHDATDAIDRLLTQGLIERVHHATVAAVAPSQSLSSASSDTKMSTTSMNDGVRATQIGNAIFGSSLGPDEGLQYHKILGAAMTNGLVTKTMLHVCYLFAPISLYTEPNWATYHNRMTVFVSMIEEEVAAKVGINMGALQKLKGCNTRDKASIGINEETLLKLKRFWYALMIQDLVDEHPIIEVATNYGHSRGEIQGLLTQASIVCGQLQLFCERLRWRSLSLMAAYLLQRLRHQTKEELLPLMRVPHVKAHRARILYEAGIRTVQQLASSSADALVTILARYQPFHLSSNKSKNSSNHDTSRIISAAALARKTAPVVPPTNVTTTTTNGDITTGSTDPATSTAAASASSSSTTTTAPVAAAAAVSATSSHDSNGMTDVIEAKRAVRHKERLRDAITIIRAARYLYNQQQARERRAASSSSSSSGVSSSSGDSVAAVSARVIARHHAANAAKDDEWDPNTDEIVGAIHAAAAAAAATATTSTSAAANDGTVAPVTTSAQSAAVHVTAVVASSNVYVSPAAASDHHDIDDHHGATIPADAPGLGLWEF